jgi:hypothetical protein
MEDWLLTPTDYYKTVDMVQALRVKLFSLAASKGNLDPEVVALSQRLDEYIVQIQRHWKTSQNALSVIS